jgi:DNA polymerase-3 subunit beta
MKFVVIRSNLKEALDSIGRVSGNIPNLPILKDALLETKDGRITLTATNLEIGMVVIIPGKIIDHGSVVIPLTLLSSILNNLQSDRLNFESKEHKIEIKTDNYTANIQGTSPKDFPQIPIVHNKEKWLDMKGIIIKEALQQVMAASQPSELRPELNSVLFDFSLETLKLASTDGFRLAEKSISKNQFGFSEDIEPFRILVPLRAAQEVTRVFGNEELVRIYHDENQIIFKTDRLDIISRLIDGQFPEYSQLIPSVFSTELVVDKDELMGAVRVVSVLGQKNNEVVFTLRADKKTLVIRSSDQVMGENEYFIPVKIKGDVIDIIFNWRYLTDAIKAIPDKEIFIGFQEETNPVIIKSAVSQSYFYILKPLMKG